MFFGENVDRETMRASDKRTSVLLLYSTAAIVHNKFRTQLQVSIATFVEL